MYRCVIAVFFTRPRTLYIVLILYLINGIYLVYAFNTLIEIVRFIKMCLILELV